MLEWHRRSMVALSIVTFRPIAGRENARPFFEILEAQGGIYLPSFIEKKREAPYEPGNHEWLASFWEPNGFNLKRRSPAEVSMVLEITPEESRKGGDASGFMLSVQAAYLASKERLAELVQLGERMYDYLSPIYGFIELPWLCEMGAGMRPDLGLPGWDWATWLGPEYEDLVVLPPADDLIVKRMSDGGRLFLCGWPQDPRQEDASVLRAYEHVMRHVDPNVFQVDRVRPHRNLPGGERVEIRRGLIDFPSEISKRVPAVERMLRLPKFRYLKGGVGRDLAAEGKVGVRQWGGYGPEGFTRTPDIRAILDVLEPDFLEGGTPNNLGGAIYFFGLSAAEAKRLLGLLPSGQADDALEVSPSFREFVALGERFPGIRYFGHRIVPGEGERITIEGFFLPAEDATPEVVTEMRELDPEELEWDVYEGRKVLRTRWD